VHNLKNRITKVDKSSIKSPEKWRFVAFFVNNRHAKSPQMRRLIARKNKTGKG
jgi:hypothetical protein